MAPEQWTAGSLQPSADVYSFGVTAIACFAGRVHWAEQPDFGSTLHGRSRRRSSVRASAAGQDGGARAADDGGDGNADDGGAAARKAASAAEARWIRDAVCAGNMPLVPQKPAVCPPELAAVVASCLHVDPAQRPTAVELVAALDVLRRVW